MPSSHRRVGLVVDEPIGTAFDVLRAQAGPSVSEAGLARKAIFDGAALGAVLHEAGASSPAQPAALQLIRDMRALLDSLGLPGPVAAAVTEEIDHVSRAADVRERRERQRALLASPNPYGADVLEAAAVVEFIDEPSA